AYRGQRHRCGRAGDGPVPGWPGPDDRLAGQALERPDDLVLPEDAVGVRHRVRVRRPAGRSRKVGPGRARGRRAPERLGPPAGRAARGSGAAGATGGWAPRGASACHSAGSRTCRRMEGPGLEVGWMSVLGELGSLVGWERGRISPAIYFDQEVYRREHARIFA